jgi:hypothetical protein
LIAVSDRDVTLDVVIVLQTGKSSRARAKAALRLNLGLEQRWPPPLDMSRGVLPFVHHVHPAGPIHV